LINSPETSEEEYFYKRKQKIDDLNEVSSTSEVFSQNLKLSLKEFNNLVIKEKKKHL